MSSRKITVLMSLKRSGPTVNPYITQLFTAIEPHVDVLDFSWKIALLGRFDVFHVHWPESLMRHRHPVKRIVKVLVFWVLLMRLALLRIPIVQTLHNVEPHERGGAFEARTLNAFDRKTAYWILINDSLPERTPRSAVILHGHYRDWFNNYTPRAIQIKGRLLYFGLIKEYKGVPELLQTFHELTGALELRLVGNVEHQPIYDQIQAAAKHDDRITYQLKYLDDSELFDEIIAAEIVVLPYRNMFNSGALLLALSLDRPVVAPVSTSNQLLAKEVGPGWLELYEGDLTALTLEQCIANIRNARQSERPNLSKREWFSAGVAHADVYSAVATSRLSPRTGSLRR
jgi:beta-1,4-mannosyltransferase